MFHPFPGRLNRAPLRLVPNQWHFIWVEIKRTFLRAIERDIVVATYFLDSQDQPVSSHCLKYGDWLEPEGVDRSLPGRFGMITYESSYSWRNAQVHHGTCEEELSIPSQTE